MKNVLILMLMAVSVIFSAQGSFAFSLNSEGDEQYNLGLSASLPVSKSVGVISYVSDTYPGAMHMGYKYFATIGKITNDPISGPAENNLSLQNIEAGIRVNF